LVRRADPVCSEWEDPALTPPTRGLSLRPVLPWIEAVLNLSACAGLIGAASWPKSGLTEFPNLAAQFCIDGGGLLRTSPA
jgi:hypothetical protein